MPYINRRRFLKSSSALGFSASTGLLAALGSSNAFSAEVNGYKALVCVFLKGGMDSMDFILPKDLPSYNALASVRPGMFEAYGVGSGNSSRDIDNILEINALNSNLGGRKFGFSSGVPELQNLFNSGQAAIVGNVGPLIEPTNRTSMNNFSVQLPTRLFSHNDQQSTWMSFGTEGTQSGWGGRLLEPILEADPVSDPVFSAISTAGNDVFLSSTNVRQFLAKGSPSSANILEQNWRLGTGYSSNTAMAALRDHINATGVTSDNLFGKDLIDINGRALRNIETYKSALNNSVGVNAQFPDSPLGNQLRTVANTISARNALNVRRQIFYVAIGGFDTHDNQHTDMPRLETQISTSISAFQNAMIEMGISDKVTLFTASDFGRTAVENGDGTDHGWGAHHLVVGGAVNGQKIYGEIPPYDRGDLAYAGDRGRLIPTTSVDQYAATLGGWFGLDQSELNDALPNLNNFSEKNLGFI